MLRDFLMFIGGMVGIGVQQYLASQGAKPNLMFLAIFTLMTGVPGATNLIGLFRSQSRIESLSSLSQPLGSQSDLEPSSQNVLGNDGKRT